MIKKKALFRNRIFKFFKCIGNVLFFRRHSNLFLVFLDSKKKHIVTLTSGSCKIGKTRKQKVSPLNMGGLIQQLKIYLNLYKIKSINFIMRQRMNFYLRRLRKLFKFYNITINSFNFILKKPHGYKRGRTPRRV